MMGYSQEQLNFFRLCHVIFTLVPVGLRQIFKTEWDYHYKTTWLGKWKDTRKNGSDFYNIESPPNHARNKRYLETVKKGNTADWDCSCLIFAILYSDSIGSMLRVAFQRAVGDIRLVRNAIAHVSEAKLTDAELQTYVERVINAFTSLGLPINDIKNIKNQTSFPSEEVKYLEKQVLDLQTELDQTKSELDQTKSDLDQMKSDLDQMKSDLKKTKEENKTLTQEIGFKLEPFCFLTLNKLPHETISRSNDVKRITNKMQELYNGANGAVSTMYLSGIPGCGKSQLAQQIGHDFYSKATDNNEDLIFAATLNAESIKTLAGSYIRLGKHLGVTEYTLESLESSKSKNPRETIQQLQHLILPKVKKFSKWMIIADNVIDLGLVCDFLPQTGSNEWGHGQVLITTQDRPTIGNAPHTDHESLSRGIQPDEAVELLETVSQISVGEQGENVARFLEYQPLALAAAAYYVKTVVNNESPKNSWSKYLETLIQTHRNVTENLLAGANSAYPRTTTTAVKMAIKRVVKIDEVLRQAFSFFAICANEVLPLEAVMMFVKTRITDQPDELIKAKIVRSSLILVEVNEGVNLRLNDIVHTVLKEEGILNFELRENDQNMAIAINVFKFLLELHDGNYVEWNKLKHHCQCLLEHMTSHFTTTESIFIKNLTPFIDFDKVIEWLGSLASICGQLSDFKFAKYVVDLACRSMTNVDDTDSSVTEITKALIFNTSGVVYDEMGEYIQAEELHKKALAIRRKIHGEDHEDVARSFSNLANVYMHKKEYNQAKELYEKALAIRKQILPSEDHVAIADSLSSLASVCFSVKEYNQAKILYENAMAIRKNILPENHSDVAGNFYNLGLVYTMLGEYKQAKEHHEKALAIRINIFGEEHEHVAESFCNLALVSYKVEEYNQAKELLEKALAIQKKIFFHDHHVVTQSYNALEAVNARIAEIRQSRKRIRVDDIDDPKGGGLRE